jgi:hypothetical protein
MHTPRVMVHGEVLGDLPPVLDTSLWRIAIFMDKVVCIHLDVEPVVFP